MSFEPNRGQAGHGVAYLARGSGYSLLLAPTAANPGVERWNRGR